MSRHIEARFEIASWDETPFEDGDDATKLTEALVAKRYHGDIKGTSTTKWLMAYSPDKGAQFVGVEHITGTLVKDAADENVRHRANVLRILTNELADTELAAVPSLSELTNPARSQSKLRHPFTELFTARVSALQSFDNRIRG